MTGADVLDRRTKDGYSYRTMNEHCTETWPHKAHDFWQPYEHGLYVSCPGTADDGTPNPLPTLATHLKSPAARRS